MCPANNPQELRGGHSLSVFQSFGRSTATSKLLPGDTGASVAGALGFREPEAADPHSLSERSKSHQEAVLGCAQSAESSERTLWCCRVTMEHHTPASTKDTQR